MWWTISKNFHFIIGTLKNQKLNNWKTLIWFLNFLFNKELNVIKTDHAFKGYATSYKVGLVEKEDPLIQLEASKSCIKDLFSDLLDETKGFKYQTTRKFKLKKIQAKGRNWIYSNLFQFNNKNSDKSLICYWQIFSRNCVQDWWLDYWKIWLYCWINQVSIH